MAQSSQKKEATQSTSPNQPGGWGLALVMFGLGAIVCAVGAVRFYAADAEADQEPIQIARDVPEPPPALPAAVPSPAVSTIPIPDDHLHLGLSVRTELQKRINAARSTNPTAEAFGLLGAFYEAHSYMTHAIQCYATAVDLDTESVRWKYYWAILAYDIADAEQAVAAMRLVAQDDPDYGPAQERLGLMLLETGKHDEAMAAFRRVVELLPDAASGYVGLGRVFFALDQPKEAAEQFQLALDRNMQDGQAHYMLGQAYQRLGQTLAAKREMARGARSNTTLLLDSRHSEITRALVGPKARLAYSRFMMGTGRPEEAIDVLTTLMLIDPTDIDVANALALAYLKNNEPEQALPVLHSAADTGRRSHLTYSYLAMTLLETGELDAALDHADQAIEIAPTTALGYFMRGRVLFALGRDAEAVGALRKAVELDPRRAEGHLRLGMASARMGRHADAIESLETAAEFSPTSAMPLYNLGMLHARSGRFDLASDALQRALKIDPFDANIRNALERVEKGRGG